MCTSVCADVCADAHKVATPKGIQSQLHTFSASPHCAEGHSHVNICANVYIT